MKERKPRWSIGNIVTTDKELLILSDEVRSMGKTHEDIYRRGLIGFIQDRENKVEVNQ